jgi:long-chain-fatty-acid--CoA ligase ACSBG
MGNKASVLAPVMEYSAQEFSKYPQDIDTHFTHDGTEEARVKYADAGAGSESECPAMTVLDLFHAALNNPGKANQVVLKQEPPELVPLGADRSWPPPLAPNQWRTWTLQEYHADVQKAAKALMHYGLKQHDAVNIWGFNSPEWILAEMGAIFAGVKAAGIYPTDTATQVLYKIRQSGSGAVFVENTKKLKVVLDLLEDAKNVRVVVIWAGEPSTNEFSRSDGTIVPVVTWNQFMKSGDSIDDAALTNRQQLIKPGHCCALIYTSGTTGNPKAVMVSHDNIVFEARTLFNPNYNLVGGVGDKPEQERVLSYLPLSHVAGMMVDVIAPLCINAYGSGWVTLIFARPYDLSVGSLGDRLRSVRPTLFIGVPRVWEKVQEKMVAIGASTKGLKLKIAKWAKKKGLKHARHCQLGGTGAVPGGYGMAKSLVFSKVKKALGLENVKFAFTGAAPIQVQTLEYFGSLGIQINEVYGMSECCGAVTWSTDATHVWGSCGYAVPGCEVKVFRPNDDGTKVECPRAADIFQPTEEEQGELCYRGRNIMMGYMANPEMGNEHVAEIINKNKSAIDADGWLHSGDKGCLGTSGMFKITGRYKELIIGAGGENVAPVPIEDNVKQLCPAVSNFVMIGNQRKYNVALVTLKAKGATGVEPGTNELDGAAAAIDPAITTIEQACAENTAIVDAILKAIVATNSDTKVVPNNASKIQKFTILPHDLSVNTGELTPTYKLKRSFVDSKFAKTIDAMYSGDKRNYIPCHLLESSTEGGAPAKE